MITCEHDTRRVVRTELDGTITSLIERFEGRPLNAPNDVVVASDGAVWFTDPGYGIDGDYEGHKATFELAANVYRLIPERVKRGWWRMILSAPMGWLFRRMRRASMSLFPESPMAGRRIYAASRSLTAICARAGFCWRILRQA